MKRLMSDFLLSTPFERVQARAYRRKRGLSSYNPDVAAALAAVKKQYVAASTRDNPPVAGRHDAGSVTARSV